MSDTAYIIYAIGAAILFGSAAFAAHRRAKATGAKGPGVFVSLLIWIALIAVIAALYFSVEVYGGLFSMLR